MNYWTVRERLLTWLDIERVFKQATELWTRMPEGVQAVRCYSDGVEIEHTTKPEAISAWLAELFAHAWDSRQQLIRLRIGQAAYPVDFVRVLVTEQPPARELPSYPLWRDVTYLKDLSDSSEAEQVAAGFGMPQPWSSGPRVVSFHSFKGGVGRTTALMTYVASRLQLSNPDRPLKVLVVDADLEAPGVTLWLDDASRPQVSYLQFLEAMHYPPVSVESSLDYFAQELRKASVSVGGAQRELFILPAALTLSDIQDMPVQPGHLARNPENPWILTDHLHALGERLGVDAVLIDLRAGLSEFSSPVLFDPRVEHFFVTTVARQAVEGTAAALERLHAFNSRLPAAQRSYAKPWLILSLLTDNLRKLPDYARAIERLGGAYPAPVQDDLAISSGLEWLEADFSEAYMSIGSLAQALDVLRSSTRLYQRAQDWARSLDLPAEQPAILSAADGVALPEKAQALRDVCLRMQYAETADASAMLVTEPLRKIGKHFASELPNLVSVGAKGAGKTFTFLQLCRSGGWHAFLRKVEAEPSGVPDAVVYPVLWSGNLEKTTKQSIVSNQAQDLKRLGCTVQPLSASNIERLVSDALKDSPAHWADFWDGLIARHFGLPAMGLEALNRQLGERGTAVVLVFDGIEEAFPDPTTVAAREAIQSLLLLPNRIDELQDRRIGAMVFVRADYVQTTIRQNVAQFLARYAPFQLQWSPEAFLRLAFWLCARSGIVDDTLGQAELLGQEALLEKLLQLWGRKLGHDKSREALSARWVFASLCDLKGNVQARDLVRFLRFAAEIETDRQGSTWRDRVLAPESLRKAIPKCSLEKVDEAAKEIEPLRQWREQLKQLKEGRVVPFDASSVGLDAQQLTVLQELGIIFEDTQVPVGEPRLYLPEIYRTGLGFETSVTGRPRTQALLKSNVALPF
ncbi:ParA family protein [Malikia sp.]|uniref:ParA family protein n=1 Tax=Malikia sp. TaxID=2070706 RepID=UPI0026259E6B|nr:ParA family protein [Malikia sp.]MDD2728025.1 ParA family protein [Malikia sp.]